ncbi:MAG: hypothetical protein ACFFCW_30920 [Candidatus Hodarchaeota archaeon]
MNAPQSEKEKVFVFEKIKARIIPEGKILFWSLFFGLAFGPALAFLIFSFLGTVPKGYTITKFYSDIRIDLVKGAWMAWAVVLIPYAIFQISRVMIWAIKTTKASITFPGQK